MDDVLTPTPEVPSSFINISLIFWLRSCRQSSELIIEDDEVADGGESDADLTSYLIEAASWLAGDSDADRGTSSFGNEKDDCHDIIHTSLGGSASVVSVFMVVFVFLTSLILTLIILGTVWRKSKACHKDEASEAAAEGKVLSVSEKEKTCEDQKDFEVKDVGALELEVANVLQPAAETKDGPETQTTMPIVISMVNRNRAIQNPEPYRFVTRLDSTQFLTYSVDHLSAQLDWILGLGVQDEPSPAQESMSSTAASLITPRMQRKGIRRPRWRTMVSLPLGAASLSPDAKTVVRTWQKVEEMEKRMNWKQLDIGDFDINAVNDSHLSTVLQFYQQVCPVCPEQWNASCLIVNYVLTLLEQELLAVSPDKNLLTVLELRSFGSAADMTCISRSDRFNVMIVVHIPSCCEMTVLNCRVCDEIPAGKLVLGVKESSLAAGRTTTQQLLQKDRVGDSFGMFLSHREVVRVMQRLITNALDRLKLKNKSLLDRLSFNLHLDQYEDLMLCVETKLLNNLGLGLSKITICFTPSVQVSSHECDPLPALYAVPPWRSTRSSNSSDASANSNRARIQSRIMRNQGVPSDLLWQLNCSALSSAFMASAERKLSSAGVTGCQVMCQQILRALFSKSGKDVLLTMGEIHPHVLDSVVFFLLLESPPSSWALTCLPDRISDCVHFLQSAVQSAWMPGFIVHNPHLLKQMPVLQFLPLLATGRQENILADVGPDAVDTILSFIDSRLQETGLRRCLKDEYSSEMWEYEFFIFG